MRAPDTSASPSSGTASTRTRSGAPPGSTVNTTPAERPGTIRMRATGIATSSLLMPQARRYAHGAGCHREAQVRRTASRACSGSTSREDRYWPANDAPAMSSTVADDRTASRDPAATSRAAAVIAPASSAATGTASNDASTSSAGTTSPSRRRPSSPASAGWAATAR